MRERVFVWLKSNVFTIVVVAILAFVLWRQHVAAPAVPEQPISLPGQVMVQPGRQVMVEAKSSGQVVWVMAPAQKFDRTFFGNTAIVTASEPGEYWIGALAVLNGKASEVAWCRVLCGGDVPNPNPNPPTPGPTDPFQSSLQAAWALEPAADKANLQAYRTVFQTGAVAVHSMKKVGDFRAFVETSRKRSVKESLRKIADVIGERLDKSIPKVEDQDLTVQSQDAIDSEFKAIDAALGKLKQ